MTSLIVRIVLLVVFLAGAAFFAAVQEAFSTLTKGRARKLVDDDAKNAAKIEQIAADPAPTVSTAQFLRLICEVGLMAVLAQWLLAVFPGQIWPVVVAGAITVVVIFVIVSVGARTLGRQRSTGVAIATCSLMKVLVAALFFIPQLMTWLGNAITPGKGFPDGPFASEDELREYVGMAEASNQIEADERRMIYSVFDLGDTLVREVMVPRLDVVDVEATKTLRQGLSLALRSGFSRIPVTGPGGLDEIVGIVYFKDLVKRVYDNPDSQSSEKVSSLLRPVTWCPDSKPADDLMREMQAAHTHMAVVVDEFGGTAGIVTIEDLLEEIVGEIQDEYDKEANPITPIEPGVYRVSSRLSLADLGELFGVELDDEDVDSVGGIMAKVLNKVPIPGSRVTWESLELTADQYTGRRHQIATVLVRRASESTGDQEEAAGPVSGGSGSNSAAASSEDGRSYSNDAPSTHESS
ncbi:MAG: hemolysin family protein [Propionibacteriaceae bacterium]|jgi:CBS domain containing-hemolysin-like protein|nr:hemolysin family protein [Propionibacteriaceae bacterium]